MSSPPLHEPPATPRTVRPELPSRLEDAILKATEKDRARSGASRRREMRADLMRIARAPGLTDARDSEPRPIASPLSPGTPAPALTAPPPSSDAQIVASLMKRHQRGLIVAGVVLLAAVIGTAIMLRPSATTRASVPTTAAVGQKSLAVLPFVDVSPGKDQEYFSDGVSEELINALSRIRDLQVTGRTSSFYFKGKNEDLQTIGKRLGVQYLLTGSVRKAAEQVRVTPGLANVETGYRLWSDSYDRPLKDIFDIQKEIAGKVAEALQVTLGVGGPLRRA